MARRRCPAWPPSGRAPGHVELEVAPGVEPASILAAVVGRGAAVNRFEIADPSLEALFIEHVGRPADDDEALLAPTPPRRRRPGRRDAA